MERNKGQNSRGGSNSRAGATPNKANVSNKGTKQSTSSTSRTTTNRGSVPLDEDKPRETTRKNVKAPASPTRGSNPASSGGARSGSGRGTGRTSR